MGDLGPLGEEAARAGERERGERLLALPMLPMQTKTKKLVVCFTTDA